MNYIWPSNCWTPNSQFSKFSCFATQLCPKLHLHAARAIKNIVHRILAVGNDRNPYALGYGYGRCYTKNHEHSPDGTNCWMHRMRRIMCPGILQAFKRKYFPHFASDHDHAMKFAFYAFGRVVYGKIY